MDGRIDGHTDRLKGGKSKLPFGNKRAGDKIIKEAIF
jgi:hypothetical protein